MSTFALDKKRNSGEFTSSQPYKHLSFLVVELSLEEKF